MFTTERVPTKYGKVTFKKPDGEVAFAELSLAMILTPELAEQIGHGVLQAMFSEVPKGQRLSKELNDAWAPNIEVQEVGFAFSIDPHLVHVFPVEDSEIKEVLKLSPVDISKLKATRDESLVRLSFSASFEVGDGKQLQNLVRLLGETIYLSYEPVQTEMAFDK